MVTVHLKYVNLTPKIINLWTGPTSLTVTDTRIRPHKVILKNKNKIKYKIIISRFSCTQQFGIISPAGAATGIIFVTTKDKHVFVATKKLSWQAFLS